MSAVPEYPRRHLVTAHEYLRMGETGVLEPVDVNEKLIRVFREPGASGYRTLEPAGHERIECVLLPEVFVTARELFPAE